MIDRVVEYTKNHHVLVSLAIFTVFYFVGASTKPFHVDEFFSWVYAENVSFKSILTLKDSGIGHPPLFHLLQKAIQVLVPGYHFIHVRIANYAIGCIFLILLINSLSRDKQQRYFFYCFSASGAVLSAFVFARMYGASVLSALLLILSGENYIRKKTFGALLLLLLSISFGFSVEYSFVLLMLYVVAVFFSGKTSYRYITALSYFSLFALWVLLSCRKTGAIGSGIHHCGYHITFDFFKTVFVFSSYIVNLWYYELLVLVFLAILGCALFKFKERGLAFRSIAGETLAAKLIVFGAFCSLLFVLHNSFSLQLRYVVLLCAPVVLLLARDSMRLVTVDSFDNRLISTIIGSFLILMASSQVFYRDLIETRFVMLLLPFVAILVYRNLSATHLKLVSLLFVVSGVVYSTSGIVDDYYPPGSINGESAIIYRSPSEYSTTYLTNGNDSSDIYVAKLEAFQTYCRVCKMGSNAIPYADLEEFLFVGRIDSYYTDYIPDDFELLESNVTGLTYFDSLFFAMLSPMRTRYFVSHYFRRSSAQPSDDQKEQ